VALTADDAVVLNKTSRRGSQQLLARTDGWRKRNGFDPRVPAPGFNAHLEPKVRPAGRSGPHVA